MPSSWTDGVSEARKPDGGASGARSAPRAPFVLRRSGSGAAERAVLTYDVIVVSLPDHAPSNDFEVGDALAVQVTRSQEKPAFFEYRTTRRRRRSRSVQPQTPDRDDRDIDR